MSSAISFNVEKSKILSFGNGVIQLPVIGLNHTVFPIRSTVTFNLGENDKEFFLKQNVNAHPKHTYHARCFLNLILVNIEVFRHPHKCFLPCEISFRIDRRYNHVLVDGSLELGRNGIAVHPQ